MWTLYVIDYIFSNYSYHEFQTLPEAVDMKIEVISEDPGGIRTVEILENLLTVDGTMCYFCRGIS